MWPGVTRALRPFTLYNPVFNGQAIMFFVIPEMPSKTFVMLYKKLPDHFKIQIYLEIYLHDPAGSE